MIARNDYDKVYMLKFDTLVARHLSYRLLSPIDIEMDASASKIYTIQLQEKWLIN